MKLQGNDGMTPRERWFFYIAFTILFVLGGYLVGRHLDEDFALGNHEERKERLKVESERGKK